MLSSHQSSAAVSELPKPDVTGDIQVNIEHIINMETKITNNRVQPAKEADPQSLMDAVVHGNLATLKLLFESGHSINQQDSDGRTPLAIACYQGWYEGSVFLLSNGADQLIADNKRRLPIHAATYDAKIRCLALLVQHMQPSELHFADNESMMALHWAAYHDRPEHVQLLISKRANMFAQDCDGKTPLHWACQRGNAKCVEILLREARGTNLVNVLDGSGKGAIHYAAAAGHHTTIECLSKMRNCNIHLCDPQYRQPLHWAAATGRVTCLELLLKLGADPNIHDVNGKNALYYAKQACHTECVSKLSAEMKLLHIAKQEELKAKKEATNKHMEELTELRMSNHNNSSQTTNGSPSSISAQKLPPIRGAGGAVKVSQATNDDGNQKVPAEDISQIESQPVVSEQESTTINDKDKPVNKAMKFKPTTKLYPHSSEENDD